MKRQLIIVGFLMTFLIIACVPVTTVVPLPVSPTTELPTKTPWPTVTPIPSPTITPTPTLVLTPRPLDGCYRFVAWRSFLLDKPSTWTMTKKFNAENWTALDIQKGDYLRVWFQVSSDDTVGMIQIFFYQKSSDTHFFIAEASASASSGVAYFDWVPEYEVTKGDYYYVSIKRQPHESCKTQWFYLFNISRK